MIHPERFVLLRLWIIQLLTSVPFTLFAQAVPGSSSATAPATPVFQQPRIKSPDILPDNKVTFRLFAPTATTVVVAGDWKVGPAGRENLVKSDSGMWSVTVGPLKPEIYGYTFSINGITALDPGNSQIRRDGARYSSQLLIPGKESELYAVNEGSKGALTKVWYDSPSLNLKRRMYVYTPAGYETTMTRYPVLYLLHGGGGDEDAWTTMGRACQILDNLMAQGKAKPMIVVMTNGNASQVASQDYVAPRSLQPGQVPDGPGSNILRFPQSLVKDVVPYVDKTFRTKTDRESRAIAGLSMGAAQTLYAGFNNLDLFAWIAGFSGGYTLLPGVAVNIPPPANAASLRGPDLTRSIDPVKFAQLHPKLDASVNAQLRLFYLSIGTDDALITTHGVLKNLLAEKGVKYTLVERPGYAHEWSFWRLSLSDLLPRLF